MISGTGLQKILSSIQDGNCCLVVGPRFRGKSKLVRRAAEALRQSGFYHVAYVSMGEITRADSQQFYRNLYRAVQSQVAGSDAASRGKVHSASDFQNAMLELITGTENNLLLQIDDLELAPPNLISLLLGAIRSVFTTVTNQSGPRFQAIVSGTVNLHQLALRGVSRFESISDLILVDDMAPDEARAFAASLFSNAGVQVSAGAVEAFLGQTSTDPVLIKLLGKACLEQIGKRKTGELTVEVVAGAAARVSRNQPNFEVKESLRQIEGDPELLACLLEIAQRGEVQMNALPLRSADSPNALDLCGVFARTEQVYSIKSPLWRAILDRYFSAAHCGRLYAIAGYWSRAIEQYERAIHTDKLDKKSELFGAVIHAMQASEDDHQAVEVLAQGLQACYPECELGIYLRSESILWLAHSYPGGPSGAETLRKEIRLSERASPEVEALGGPDYSILFRKRKPRYLIPLRVHSGAPATGLISYCGGHSGLNQHRLREEILQMISFIQQAARAIEGRRKYSQALQGAKSHARTLESLDYILTSVLNHPELSEEEIFRLLLAGLTANECLAFNRAALFLHDDRTGKLTGTMGVGHLAWEDANLDWKNYPHNSLDELLTALMAPDYRYTPLHPVITSIGFDIYEEDVFGRILKSGAARQSSALAAGLKEAILNSPLRAIDPPAEFAVAPLTAGTRRLGLVYVDNKFTHRPIDSFQMASLTSFLTQATLVMEMARSLKAERQRLKLEETLRDTSLIIGSSLELKEVLQRILEEMRKVLPFDTASIQLADEKRGSLKIFAHSGFDHPERVEALEFPIADDYPNVRVYRQKEPLHFDDVQEHFPHFAEPRYQGTHIHGWLGAPLIVHDRAIGVITLDSNTGGIYTPEHDRMAVLFAGQASVAIENARLFETERETREYLDLLIASSQDGIISVDNQGRVMRYSEGAQKILGYSTGEIGQKRADELYGSLEVAQDINHKLMAAGRVRDYETTVADKNHNTVPIVLSASLLRDKVGNPLGSVGFFKDLRPLRKIENNLRTILDTVSIMSRVDHSEQELRILAERIVTAQPVTFCTILLLDETKQNLVVKVAHPNPRPLSSGVRWRPATGKVISLTKSRLMHYLVNLPEPQVFQQGERTDGMAVIGQLQRFVLLDEEIRSALVVPMKAGSEVFGICILGEARSWERSPFDDNKIELISSMVTQGAVFVDRLQAHEATESKLLMVERLRSIGEELVTASPGMARSILDKVARAAHDVTGASSVVIYPWDKQMRTYHTDQIAHFGLVRKKPFSRKIRDEEGSMTSIVVKQGMVIVDDIRRGMDRSATTPLQADRGGFLETEGVRAFVGISLGTREDALGVLFVNYRQPHFFTDSELEAVRLFANQAAIAIENARLYEDLALRLEESATLQRVGTALSGTRELNVVLDRVMQAALELIHADEGNILFYDETRDEFEIDALVSAGRGLPLQKYRTSVRQQDGLTYEIIQSKKPINIPDTSKDARVNRTALEKGRRAIFGVPLIGRESPVGVLWMNWKKPRRILEREERLLMALASQAAVSIENANLIDQLKTENARRKEESQALQEVGISLTEPIELNGVLYRVLQAALELVHADEGSILFYDEASEQFQPDALMCAGIARPLETYQTQVRQRSGLAYEIITEKKPVFIPDTLLDPRISKVAIDKGRRATVGVPLLDHEGPAGVLWVNWREPRQVSSREASLLTALASQATVAIKGAKRYADIQKHTRFQKGLLAASEGIISLKESGEILQAITENIRNTFECDVVTLYTYDQENEEIDFPAYVSGELFSPGALGNLGRVSQASVVKKIIESGKPHFADHAAEDAVMISAAYERQQGVSPFVARERIRSSAGIPLVVGVTTVGILFINYRKLHPFSQQEKNAIQVFATQTATVIQIARTYEAIQRKTAHLQAVHEAGKVIAAASVGLGKQQILEQILQQAIECVTGVAGSKATVGTIQLTDEKTNALKFQCIYPPEDTVRVIAEFGEFIYLESPKGKHGRIGVTGRAAQLKEAQLVPDVNKDPDYLAYHAETRSELAVPFMDADAVIGVLDVESDQPNAFDEDDKVSLKRLADLAVVALRNAERAEQLARSNAVALMGAWGAEIVHDVNREVGYIRREIFLLQQTGVPPEINSRLKKIDEYAEHLALPDLSERRPDAESWLAGKLASGLSQIIQTTVDEYRASHPQIIWEFRPPAAELQVSIHKKWLHLILRHLLRNAAFALSALETERTVRISTTVDNSMAMVEVADTGPGVRSEIVPQIFREAIAHTDGRKGSGLLLIRFLAEQYGGRIELAEPRQGRGACFRVWLPRVAAEAAA